MIFFRKNLFRFILPQIARIFTDFLLLEQQLLADEWMCSPLGIICVHLWNPWEIIYPWGMNIYPWGMNIYPWGYE